MNFRKNIPVGMMHSYRWNFTDEDSFTGLGDLF